jgi:hypothetical protein
MRLSYGDVQTSCRARVRMVRLLHNNKSEHRTVVIVMMVCLVLMTLMAQTSSTL